METATEPLGHPGHGLLSSSAAAMLDADTTTQWLSVTGTAYGDNVTSISRGAGITTTTSAILSTLLQASMNSNSNKNSGDTGGNIASVITSALGSSYTSIASLVRNSSTSSTTTTIASLSAIPALKSTTSDVITMSSSVSTPLTSSTTILSTTTLTTRSADVIALRGPFQVDTLAMPAYAWVLALLFGICCGLALLAAVVSVFRCVRRRDYARLGAEQRQGGGLIPAYMQYVYGSAGPLGSGSGSGQGSGSGHDSPSSLDSNSDYTFVGVSIPLLQDVTRI